VSKAIWYKAASPPYVCSRSDLRRVRRVLSPSLWSIRSSAAGARQQWTHPEVRCNGPARYIPSKVPFPVGNINSHLIQGWPRPSLPRPNWLTIGSTVFAHFTRVSNSQTYNATNDVCRKRPQLHHAVRAMQPIYNVTSN